jgi:hypothetical protein
MVAGQKAIFFCRKGSKPPRAHFVDRPQRQTDSTIRAFGAICKFFVNKHDYRSFFARNGEKFHNPAASTTKYG